MPHGPLPQPICQVVPQGPGTPSESGGALPSLRPQRGSPPFSSQPPVSRGCRRPWLSLSQTSLSGPVSSPGVRAGGQLSGPLYSGARPVSASHDIQVSGGDSPAILGGFCGMFPSGWIWLVPSQLECPVSDNVSFSGGPTPRPVMLSSRHW